MKQSMEDGSQLSIFPRSVMTWTTLVYVFYVFCFVVLVAWWVIVLWCGTAAVAAYERGRRRVDAERTEHAEKRHS